MPPWQAPEATIPFLVSGHWALSSRVWEQFRETQKFDTRDSQVPSAWHLRVGVPEKPGRHVPVATVFGEVVAQVALL